jgi:spore maturation protein CgeB
MTRHRIVFAGEFWLGASGDGLATALERLGHDVRRVDIGDQFALHPSIVERIDMRLRRNAYINRYRKAVMTAVRDHQATMLLTLKGSYVDAAMLADLRQSGVLTVNFYPDVLFEHGDVSWQDMAGYDLIVTTKSFHLDWLAERRAPECFAYVPHGYSPACHAPRAVPADDAGYRWDVCYAGNASAYKKAWLAPQIAATPDLNWLLIGHRWDDLAFANCERPGGITGAAYADAAAQSRVNIAIHSGRVGPDGWEDLVSTRSFEIPASGGFMLHIDNDEIRAFYQPGREIDVFSTPDEAVAKIRHHLAHPTERMAIAAAGCARATPAYSYDARAAEMMAIIADRFSAGF